MIIKPTVGRMLWYYPEGNTPEANQPLAAQIAFVHSDTDINIGYLDKNGKARSVTSVLLYNEGIPMPTTNFCTWMPYQQGQAQKTEALELAAAARAEGPTSY